MFTLAWTIPIGENITATIARWRRQNCLVTHAVVETLGQSLEVTWAQLVQPASFSVERARMTDVESSDHSHRVAQPNHATVGQHEREFAERNPRIELIGGDNLIRLLNEQFGAEWPSMIDFHIAQSRRAYPDPPPRRKRGEKVSQEASS